MLKFYRLLALCVMQMALCLTVKAVPAYPWPVTVTQPDGTTVTLQGHGDEWFNWTTTADGYTVVRDPAGYWCYAREQDGHLAATERVARDRRTEADLRWLATVKKNLLTERLIEQGRQTRQARQLGRPNRLQGQGDIDFDKFRGLVILVNYNDCSFASSLQLWDDMLNRPGFTGYNDSDTGEWVECTGSLRDYFDDNSGGMFCPEFDIVGPVDVDRSQTYINQITNSITLFSDVLELADSLVDYSDYDSNGDGVVDMVYFIVAGASSNYHGNNTGYLWPHATTFIVGESPKLDNMTFGRYAASTELQGSEPYTQTNGIGTICHEFSHVLNLPDLYDTDYSTNGLSNHPDNWSVMASGCYLNNDRTPAGYSVYERYVKGFIMPEELNTGGTYRLEALQRQNKGYRINTLTENEFFLLENRQQTRWDKYLPGHGLLVWHVDSTDVDAWEQNRVNTISSHNLYELVRATNSIGATGADPFPGTGGVTELGNALSRPTLMSWRGLQNPITLSSITESMNEGIVSFNVDPNPVAVFLETFEQMPVTTGDTIDCAGSYTDWRLIGAAVCQPDTTCCNGQQAVSMVKGSVVQTSKPLADRLFQIRMQFSNPNTFTMLVQVSVSTDHGVTWTPCSPYGDSQTLQRVPAKTTQSLNLAVDNAPGALFRISAVSGISGREIYLDDIEVYLHPDNNSAVMGDVTGDGVVDIADVNAVINVMLGLTPSPSPGGEGSPADVTGDGQVDIADVNAVINIMLGK